MSKESTGVYENFLLELHESIRVGKLHVNFPVIDVYVPVSEISVNYFWLCGFYATLDFILLVLIHAVLNKGFYFTVMILCCVFKF